MTGQMSRSQRQKAAYDKMLTPMKDFYDFARDCYVELGKEKRRQRIFRSVLLERCRADRQAGGGEKKNANHKESGNEIGAYCLLLAKQLAAESPSLLRWSPAKERNTDREPGLNAAMWEKSLTLWCQEDSFPSLYDRELPCRKRDVVLYVLLVGGFTVEQSQELLGELSRRKDRKEVRPLYPLDLKEGFFLWLLRWNEKHPRNQVSFSAACERYEDYGRALYAWLDDRIEMVEKEVSLLRDRLKEAGSEADPDVEKELTALQENYRRLWRKLQEKWDLFEEEQAENAKRLLAVVTCAKKYAAYEMQALETGVRGRTVQEGREWRQREFKRRNADTRMTHGTRYVGEQLDYLAGLEDWNQAFSAMCGTLWEEFGEAHWRTYSTLIWLYGQSGRENWNNRLFIPGVRPSVKTTVGRRYGTVDIFREGGQRQSFFLSGKSVSRLVDAQAANGKLISNLLTPVLRNENLVSSLKNVDSSVVFSNLKNNYQNWLKGRRGPYEFYKRGTILKFLLAAGIEDPVRLNRLMEMAGSRDLDYLDARESLVYLTASWRAKLKGIYDNLASMEDSFERGDVEEELWEQAAEFICSLPPQFGVRLLGLEADDGDNLSKVAERLKEDPFVIEDEIFPELEKWFETSLIYDLKHMESLFVSFEAEEGTSEETLEKLFYGPYTADFQKTDEKKKVLWADFMRALWAVIGLAGDWVREPKRLIFEKWWADLSSGQTFAAEAVDQETGIFPESHRFHLEEVLDEVLQNQQETETQKKEQTEKKAAETSANLAIRLARLNDAAEQAVFLCQNPCALEAEAALELWFYALSLWRSIGVGCDSEAYQKSEELLRERACYWYCVCQMENFDLKWYRKAAGCGNYGERKEADEESVVTAWSHQETDGYPFADEEDQKIQALFQMWERIYCDTIRLEEGMEALREENPALFRSMKDLYQKFYEMLCGPVKEEWKKAIREQKENNPAAEKAERLKEYYRRIYDGTADRIRGEF